MDSGCSRHMTGSKNCLKDFKDIKGPSVTFGDGKKKGSIKGIGSLKINGLTIKEVAYVEGLGYNLISTS